MFTFCHVYVFKTNVRTRREAIWVCRNLEKTKIARRATMDLDDCDRILRVETTEEMSPIEIINFLNHVGHTCEELN